MSTTTGKTVAILGNGVVGVALAKGFVARGNAVVFGTRDAQGEKTQQALREVPGARASNYLAAAREADLAVIALPWDGLVQTLEPLGEALAGKLVIDASNPLEYSGGAPQLAIGHTDSAGERVQRLLPQARVVKTFNCVTASHMVDPQLPGGEPDMFIAGEDAAAKAEAAAWLKAFGWRSAIDLGGIAESRLLEALAMLWIRYGVTRQHWSHAFSLLGQAAEG
ncbi:NAD(P)-binding domain-containing protein [Niveibacterium sp. SC-1]|uniref:NADPH-dependent F420 reductase n=1 Tax=Niveibacterium sp. SC-1 TaxID=3135646 RepID=UPI00311E4A2B